MELALIRSELHIDLVKLRQRRYWKNWWSNKKLGRIIIILTINYRFFWKLICNFFNFCFWIHLFTLLIRRTFWLIHFLKFEILQIVLVLCVESGFKCKLYRRPDQILLRNKTARRWKINHYVGIYILCFWPFVFMFKCWC